MGSQIEIKESQSERLHKIAVEKGVSPNVLLEEALELLFQQTEKAKIVQEEQVFLQQLEAESDISSLARTRPPFHKEEITITHRVPVDPATIRHLRP